MITPLCVCACAHVCLEGLVQLPCSQAPSKSSPVPPPSGEPSWGSPGKANPYPCSVLSFMFWSLSSLSSNTIAYISHLSVDGSILVAGAVLGFFIFISLYCHFKVGGRGQHFQLPVLLNWARRLQPCFSSFLTSVTLTSCPRYSHLCAVRHGNPYHLC